MRVSLLLLAAFFLASCARDEGSPPDVTEQVTLFDSDVERVRKSIAFEGQTLRKDFRDRTIRDDFAQWVLTQPSRDKLAEVRQRALKTKSAEAAATVLKEGRDLQATQMQHSPSIQKYWGAHLPAPFWREYWNALFEANGLPIAPPDSLLVSIEGDMKAALDRGDFAQAATKAEELVPVLETAIDGATGRLTRQVKPAKFSARKSPCPRGIAPDAGQSKPQLVDSRPVNDFYPPAAIARGETGSLVLRARVDADGCAKEFAIVVRSGVESLNAAALEWFETARYSPATRGGRAVDAEHTFKVKFVLR